MAGIVSLLPSATEIICELGLGDRLAGVTHECDWPPFVRDLPRVTHTLIPTDVSSAEIDALVREKLSAGSALYTLDMKALAQIQPDLIVTQALCDVCAVAEDEVNAAACTLPGMPRVINLEPESLDEVLQCMLTVGRAAGVEQDAENAIARLRARVNAVRDRTRQIARRPRVFLLEWLDPFFSCGHWSPELIEIAGGVEGVGKPGERSRQISLSEIVEWQPEALVIACCGMTVERTQEELHLLWRHDAIMDLPAVRDNRVYVMDGAAYFSRPGPRLVESIEVLANALHPEVHPLPAGLRAATPAQPPIVGSARSR